MKKTFNRNWLKIASIIVAFAMLMSIMAACGKSTDVDDNSSDSSANSSTSSSSSSSSGSSDSSDSSVSTEPKDLVMVMSSDVGDLSPYGGDSGGRHHTYKMLYDALCAAKGLGQPVDELEMQIAKSVTIIDGVTAEVEIYDYVKDDQGNEIKASDVEFSYNAAIEAGTNDKLKGYLASITVTGDYTLEIKLNSAFVGAMEWVLTSVPIVSQSWFEAASDADKTSDPATTGAYSLIETVAGSHTTLQKNDDYWQTDESLRAFYDQQTFDTITINVVKESSMRAIALQNEEADLAHNVPAAEISTFLNDDGTSVEGWNVFANSNGRFNVFMFNNSNSVFADNKELRQAVLYGIDFEAVRQGYGNTATNGSICHDFGPEVAGDYNMAWNDEGYFEYNIDKAKELMAAAGYPDGGFTVRLMYQNSTTATSGLTVVQAYLAELGITVELLPYDQALYNSYKYDDTQWDMIVDSKGCSGSVTSTWSDVFNTNNYENGSACFTHDETLQELLETACDTATYSEDSLNAFHNYLKDQAYGIAMFFNYSYYVAQDGVTDMYQDGMGNLTVGTVSVADDYTSVAE